MTNDKFQKGFKTTKLSKWLFPPERVKPKIIVQKQVLVNPETSTFFKRNLFFIFKKRQKQSTIITTADGESSSPQISRFEIYKNI